VYSSPDFTKLSTGYREDMALAEELEASHITEKVAVFSLPDQAWARRVSGVYSNDLATDNPGRAHAVLTQKSNGNYLISVRAPLNDKRGAAELCMQFPTGGGRAAAAGINDLPAASVDAFVDAFSQTYK
jgi:hypothetical protein